MITQQSELVTAIQGALANRADITSALCAEYIQRFEAKANRRLRTIDQETKSTSYSITGQFVNVPSSFKQVRSFTTTAGGIGYSLKYMPPELMADKFPSGTDAPLYYAVVGSQFQFAPVPDQTYTATLVYYVTLSALGTTSSNTNWLLQSHPDLYLYGSLLEAEAYIQNDPRVPMWKAGMDEGFDEIIRQNNRDRWGGPGLYTRPG